MPDSGTGYGTPISGGVPHGVQSIEPLPRTHLSLFRYAQIMGIAPMHFARAATPSLRPVVFPTGDCSDVWFKYSWQSVDKVSWEQLAETIQNAENELADYLGFALGPEWNEEEGHNYPRPYPRDAHGGTLDVRGEFKSINARRGKYLAPGRRAVEHIATVNTISGDLVYSDEDDDGFYETATIVAATDIANIHEIKVYFADTNADPRWEIRPVRSKQLDGGMVEFIFHSWLFINPELYEDFPTDDGTYLIDISTVANFVASVDVYREYIDTTQASAEFYWENPSNVNCVFCGGTGCSVCSYTTQEGCLNARDPKLGVLVPYPAVYNEDDEAWSRSSLTVCRAPDLIKLWYKAGEISSEYISGASHDPLSRSWAVTIAAMATARLHRPLCGCSRVKEVADYWQTDMAFFSRESRHFLTDDVIQSPFGTRQGEVMAWRRIKKLVKDKRPSYAII